MGAPALNEATRFPGCAAVSWVCRAGRHRMHPVAGGWLALPPRAGLCSPREAEVQAGEQVGFPGSPSGDPSGRHCPGGAAWLHSPVPPSLAIWKSLSQTPVPVPSQGTRRGQRPGVSDALPGQHPGPSVPAPARATDTESVREESVVPLFSRAGGQRGSRSRPPSPFGDGKLKLFLPDRGRGPTWWLPRATSEQLSRVTRTTADELQKGPCTLFLAF